MPPPGRPDSDVGDAFEDSVIEIDTGTKQQLDSELKDKVDLPSATKPDVEEDLEAKSKEEDDDDKDEYIVEAILDHKIDETGACSYLIKWQDFDKTQNTWEPPENLLPNCWQLFAAYHEEVGRVNSGLFKQSRQKANSHKKIRGRRKAPTKRVGVGQGPRKAAVS